MRRLYDLHLFSDYGKEIKKLPSKEELEQMLVEIKLILKML